MHGLVLAGGDGSRLLASGISDPKAFVTVAGEPQLRRMVAACRRVGCATVTCAVRADLAAEAVHLLDDPTVQVISVRTPSSLHTLQAGLEAVADGPVVCTLVDTVMPDADWDRAHAQGARALQSAAAAVVVTPYVADDVPLWVDADAAGRVLAFGRRGTRDLVTGGVYWLGAEARAESARATADGVMRLRGYLARLVSSGARVMVVEVPKIVDIDTAADLEDALLLVHGEHA
ncbi:MAG TPA: NTP transferase domain-containing protein [Gemmatimonadales bacterium]|jgi:NDP-sugar pyrophosphorylase family protein